MNYKIVLKTIGKILCIEAILLMLPLIVSFIYQDNNHFAFLITIGVLILVGLPLVGIKANKQMFVKTNVHKQLFEKRIDKNTCSMYTV